MEPLPFQKTNRSAYLNFLHAKYETYTGAIRVRSLPYYVSMDPSDKCQLRCPTCPTGIENESRRSKTEEPIIFRKHRSKLAPELFDALLNELGEYLFLLMFYNYGEPLLNEHLADFIRKAKSFNIETEVHTNLSLPLSDQRIENLLSSGLDRLEASIDGFSQETYQIHRVGGNLRLVKNNLERLAKARDRLGLKTCITYNFLVFSFNEHELPAAEKYSKELGIYFNRRDAFMDNSEWLPSYRKDEQPRVVPKEASLNDEITLSYTPPVPQPQESNWPSSCAWHYGYSVVSAGGPIVPCCPIAKEKNDFGTVVPGRVNFADVWNNDLYRKSRAVFSGKEIKELDQVDTVCVRCPYPKFIQHLYSLHDAKVITQFYKVFKESDPILEQAFDLLSQTRYGLSMHALCQRGLSSPPEKLFVGNENKNGTARFVDFFEKSLIEGISPARPDSSGHLNSLKIT